jgi:hypothetical protein
MLAFGRDMIGMVEDCMLAGMGPCHIHA